MFRRTPGSTPTAPPFPYTTLFRCADPPLCVSPSGVCAYTHPLRAPTAASGASGVGTSFLPIGPGLPTFLPAMEQVLEGVSDAMATLVVTLSEKIGRAHV